MSAPFPSLTVLTALRTPSSYDSLKREGKNLSEYGNRNQRFEKFKHIKITNPEEELLGISEEVIGGSGTAVGSSESGSVVSYVQLSELTTWMIL